MKTQVKQEEVKKEAKPKKLFLTEEERKNVQSRQGLLAQHQFYAHMINNSIADYLKLVVYKRLNLDEKKDYPLANNGEYLLVEEQEEK